MGKGQAVSRLEVGRVPATTPPFTLGDLKRAIPAHCWERNTLRSFSYLLADVAVCSLLWVAALYIDTLPVPTFVKWALWPLYWFWQGAFGTGIWVVSHECGHGAFSDKAWVNDAVGWVFHSVLLVPYYSWKHTHRRHHQNTGSVARDEVFVPSVLPAGTKIHWFKKTPIYRAGHLIVQQLLGWPMYLALNTSGHETERWANHFDPYSPLFTKKERIEVVYSDLGVAAMLTGLGMLGKAYGFVWLLKMYIIPYLIVNHWLVMITYLQHTHVNLPHYDDKEWDWLRGALATVDRSYGILDHVFHHIADTHVAHHLFSYMPHYHAQEATEAIKKVLGDYYAKDSRNVFRALWEEVRDCNYVSPDKPGEKVYWYNKPAK
mmetsp:Transcript_9899/g.24739  ORF Transcript_9899/g.24739 Transcript_9899/m.24739 type:complete len:375 (-) Transcript_9899:396-1520(-)|eukprot:CAMPEP_0202868896 /NCGR_PEP_ID=MMETSP1391-20130828/11319_1 /ASSEMBLY_ACC=CAM_ASM_000867 /TAXON_ID=1034604 /ORGANISM="Chlamydomonas leiostraca, Strain SAG 11-49" /LENGTH=374 /DNA_ID=CAMNT_0049549119 /DNA_START=98 /DNA_END=1222 /DNA_ORIENTATION=-